MIAKLKLRLLSALLPWAIDEIRKRQTGAGIYAPVIKHLLDMAPDQLALIQDGLNGTEPDPKRVDLLERMSWKSKTFWTSWARIERQRLEDEANPVAPTG